MHLTIPSAGRVAMPTNPYCLPGTSPSFWLTKAVISLAWLWPLSLSLVVSHTDHFLSLLSTEQTRLTFVGTSAPKQQLALVACFKILIRNSF